MKKTKALLMIAVSLMLVDIPFETMASERSHSTELTTIGGRRKGYKPKRGGLFNTGLVRKKSPCGCPNH